MSSVFLLFAAAAALLFFVANYFRRLILWRQSPLNHLRGPRSESLIFGHFNLLEADYPSLHAKWFEYGPTMRTVGILSVSRRSVCEKFLDMALIGWSRCFRPPCCTQ